MTPVLVDAGLVGERVRAHDRLVRLDREAGEVADTAGDAAVICSVWTCARELRELRRTGPEGHHDLLQARVAGALAEAVDGDLHLAGAGLDGGERVRRGEPQVVVAVHADGGVAHRRRSTTRPTRRAELGRDRVADRVGDVHRGRARLDHRLVDLRAGSRSSVRDASSAENSISASGPSAFAPTTTQRTASASACRAIHAQLVLEVDVAGGDEHVEVRALGDADRLDGPLRVAVPAAGERRHGDAALRLLGDPPDRLEVAGRRGREARPRSRPR